MKLAVTGASGFIGSSLSRHLHQQGHEVLAFVRSPDKGKPLEGLGIRTRICDVTDRDGLKEALLGIDGVFHLAALFNRPEASWEEYRSINIGGTQNVLDASLECNVKRVIHCSTVGVAVGSGKPPFSETTPYSPPLWDKYETTKCEAEKFALDFHCKTSLSVVVIRPAQVYGPGDTGKAKFYKMVKKGIIVNAGDTYKHLIYISDLCEAFELAMKKEEAIGEVLIIAGEKAIPLKELITMAADELGVPRPKIMLPATPITLVCALTESLCNVVGIKPFLFRRSMDFFTRSVQVDASKASRILDFKARTTVQEGVQGTVAWYKEMGLI